MNVWESLSDDEVKLLRLLAAGGQTPDMRPAFDRYRSMSNQWFNTAFVWPLMAVTGSRTRSHLVANGFRHGVLERIDAPMLPLSIRKTAVLRLLANGHRYDEIAYVLSRGGRPISQSGVHGITLRLMRDHGVHNAHGLTARAFHADVIK